MEHESCDKTDEKIKVSRNQRCHFNQIFQIIKIKNKKKWTKDEDNLLISLAESFKEKHWKEISKNFANKNALQCFSRYKRIRPGIVKGSWSKEEDEKILHLVRVYGKAWSKISKVLMTRNGKQIRDRFINVLDPEIKKGKFSEEEDKNLIKLYIYYGPKWATISKHFLNRTADMIKNRFHSSIKKIFFSGEANGSKESKTLKSLRDKYNILLEESINEQPDQILAIQAKEPAHNANATSTVFFSLPSTKLPSPSNTNENKVIQFKSENEPKEEASVKRESNCDPVTKAEPAYPIGKDANTLMNSYENFDICNNKESNRVPFIENYSIDNEESGTFFNFEDYFTV